MNPQHGEVNVYFGSRSGLSALPDRKLTQGTGAFDGYTVYVGDATEGSDRLGSVLAAGDHDGDGFDDLAIGVPNENVNFLGVDEGMVHLVFGAEYGFRTSTRTLTQSSLGTAGQNNAQFGRTLAMGNTTSGSPGDELYIGVPLYDAASNLTDSGVVYESRSNGGRALLSQGNLGEFTEAGDRFGWALALGDFDGNGFKDFAIGSPAEDLNAIADVGVVQVIPSASSGTGLVRSSTRAWTQNSTDFPDSSEAGDTFGASLSAWNFGRGSPADLAIGVPYEDSAGFSNLGFVQVTYGGFSTGLGGAGSVQTWSQASTGIGGTAESNDLFGYSLY